MRLPDKDCSLPEGWHRAQLGDCCRVRDELRLPLNVQQRAKMQGAYPYYGPTGIVDHLNTYKVDGRFALIGEDGDHFLKFSDWGMTQLAIGKFNVNNHAHILQGNDRCTTDWIFWFFHHRDLRGWLTLQGVGRWKLTQDALKRLPILVPPVGEQRRITKLLTQWAEGETQLRALVKAKRRIRRGLMQQLLTGRRRFPEFTGRSWREVRIGEVLQETFRPVTWDDDSLYRLASVRRASRGLFWREPLYGRQIKVKKLHIIRTGDFLLSHIQAAYGAMSLVPPGFDGGHVSDMYTVLVPRDASVLEMAFFGYLAERPEMRHAAYDSSNGFFAERLRLNFDPQDFLRRRIVIPPTKAEQQKIATVLTAADREIALLEEQVAILRLQKKGLMQKLLTGQVRLPKFHPEEVTS